MSPLLPSQHPCRQNRHNTPRSPRRRTKRKPNIISGSKYAVDGITKHLSAWEDRDWLRAPDRDLFDSTASHLRARSGPTFFQLAPNFAQLTGGQGARANAEAGLQLPNKNPLPTGLASNFQISGARLSKMTQSLVYQGILRLKPPVDRRSSREYIHMIQSGVRMRTNFTPTPSHVWLSVHNKTITRNIRAFLWRCLHQANHCGSYWLHIPQLTDRELCHECQTTESLSHIILECGASGQATIWKLTKKLWELKGIPWPTLNLGSILGCGITNFHNTTGKPLPGANRLYSIIISESAHLIWKLRCEWRIQHNGDASQKHSETEINRWLKAINTRLQTDCLLTNSIRYGSKALSPVLVQCTWQGTLQNEQSLSDDWHKSAGVLVGIGTRRPPGRNR
jgi:hypothetical protein